MGSFDLVALREGMEEWAGSLWMSDRYGHGYGSTTRGGAPRYYYQGKKGGLIKKKGGGLKLNTTNVNLHGIGIGLEPIVVPVVRPGHHGQIGNDVAEMYHQYGRISSLSLSSPTPA